MIICPKCKSSDFRKYGMINRVVMTFSGKKIKSVQRYQCHNGHLFRALNGGSDWDDAFIETVVYTYLQCLSLNTTIAIIRMFYRGSLRRW